MKFKKALIRGRVAKLINMEYEFKTLANIHNEHEIVIPFVIKGSFFASNSENTIKIDREGMNQNVNNYEEK